MLNAHGRAGENRQTGTRHDPGAASRTGGRWALSQQLAVLLEAPPLGQPKLSRGQPWAWDEGGKVGNKLGRLLARDMHRYQATREC